MGKWVTAAILYVAVVIGAYTVYDEWIADNQQAVSEEKQHDGDIHDETQHDGEIHDDTQEGSHAHQSDREHADSSEVNAFVQADKADLKIFLKDKAGNPVHELEVNHEKLLHLIIVDDRMQQYYHLHPKQAGEGEFIIQNTLPDGFYKAFIDIKPKNLAYQVAPVPFVVGNPDGSAHGQGLKPDTTLTQHVDGETVQLHMSSFEINKPVTVTFDLDKTNLTPYLGAMGHVVILDENAQQYLHVHPTHEDEPIFETQFHQPGIYKIWAEFKQNGKVRAFPFVVEIKGEK